MPKTVYIRNLPDHVHKILKSRAAREGMTLSEFLKRELERIAARPDFSDLVGQ
ncbi:MAG TPA: hypothetical protein VFB14_24555 [Bryobacteraceae bacterium]|nr:hypothetical protein [Bryobacteraceae bacterium]